MRTYDSVEHDGHDEIMHRNADRRSAMKQFQWQNRLPSDFRLDKHKYHKQHRTGDKKPQDPRIRPSYLILTDRGSLERDRDEEGADKSS